MGDERFMAMWSVTTWKKEKNKKKKFLAARRVMSRLFGELVATLSITTIYGVATMSRRLKIIHLFCKRAL